MLPITPTRKQDDHLPNTITGATPPPWGACNDNLMCQNAIQSLPACMMNVPQIIALIDGGKNWLKNELLSYTEYYHCE
jgi:hypothetical protein